MFKRFKGEFVTLPNLLSYARIALIPFIAWTFCYLKMNYLSAVLVAISGLTDCVDGYIARHFDMITDFGKIIDPIADKLTQITGKTVELQNKVDPAVLGGVRLDYDGKRVDGTVQSRLDSVRDLLKNTTI